jgi:hypothetical protein
MKRKAPKKTTTRRRTRSARPKSALIKHPLRQADLEIKAAKDGYMIYEPAKDRVHYLNHTAVVVLELCDGKTPARRIAETLRRAYGLASAPHKDVDRTLSQLKGEGLVR